MAVRLRRLILRAALLLGGGLVYAAFCIETGWAVPCLFRRITGLRCPGCGVTRMCLALLRGDLAAAWAASPGLLLLSPFLGLLLLDLAVRYVRTGQRLPGPVERAGIWCAVAWLVLYGVIRNLAGF